MNKSLAVVYVAIAFVALPFVSCKKDGLNSPMAKKIQYRWERVSQSSATDYLDGRALIWTVTPAVSGSYLEFHDDGYYYSGNNSSSTKFEYKVDGEKILSLLAGPSRTTPQYTDTSFIDHVDDHLLVLSRRKYFSSGAYGYVYQYIDSLKK